MTKPSNKTPKTRKPRTRKPMPDFRICKVCQENKPIHEFSSNRNPKYPESRRHQCTVCEKIETNNRNKRNYFQMKRYLEAERKSENIIKLDETDDESTKTINLKVSLRCDGRHRVIEYSDDNDLDEKENMEPTEKEMKMYEEWANKKWKADEEEFEKYRKDNKIKVVKIKKQKDEMIDDDHISDIETIEQQVVETLDDDDY